MLNSATYSLSPDLRYVMVVHDAKRVFRQTSSSSCFEFNYQKGPLFLRKWIIS